jgi:glycosyltransferase involved in cell wall biosynthesis
LRPAPDLVLFTARFPYDEHELVLASELEVTAERFRRIFILPSRGGTRRCELPSNAVVVDPSWIQDWPRRLKLRALRTRTAARVMGATLANASNWRSYASGMRSYLDILATNLLKARSLSGWIDQNGLGQALFYDYWFENSTLAISALRRSGRIRCAVARAHNFDIYDSAWSELGRVPFREFKAQGLDAIFAISEDGARYLRARLERQGGKVSLARLGIPMGESYSGPRVDPPLVVSCAWLRPPKRVHLIPEVLRACERPLRWVHFGDGPERSRVESAAASLPDRVSFELRGRVRNAEVQEFYRTRGVSAFLSLSLSEGIPIAMMEAQAAGIPTVACAAGGVPEIVSEDAGLLLPPEASVSTVAGALNEAISPSRFDPARVRDAFARRFEAGSNYREFADTLLSVWESSVAPDGGRGARA